MNKTIVRNILIIMMMVINCMTTVSQPDDRGYIVKTGETAPDFTVTTTEGKVFTLSEQRGKIVMLQFTASWCGVCRKEMPYIEREIWQPLRDNDFVLIGLDRDEPADVVREFASKTGVTYPLAPDPAAAVFSLYAEKQAGITRNVIIDRDGKIVYLTRLFDLEEFYGMKETIWELMGLPLTGMEKLSWMAGTWENRSEDGNFIETWRKINDTLYLGESFLVKEKDTVFSEIISLSSASGEILYTVGTSNQNDGRQVPFRLVSDKERVFVFENKNHDFPQEIIYRHPAPDSLHARIQGWVNGEERFQDFPMKRVTSKR